MSMNDPRDPYIPPRDRYLARDSSIMPWVLGALIAIFVLGLVMFGIGPTKNTVATDTPTTTGQGGATVNQVIPNKPVTPAKPDPLAPTQAQPEQPIPQE